MPPPPLPRKKPFFLFSVIGFALLMLLSQARQILMAVSGIGDHGVIVLLGTVVIAGLVIAFSGWILHALSGDRIRHPAPLKVYLWCMLLIYPLTNLARTVGLYLPFRPLPDALLFWGALSEIFRYLTPIVLLVWAASSRALRDYFAQTR